MRKQYIVLCHFIRSILGFINSDSDQRWLCKTDSSQQWWFKPNALSDGVWCFHVKTTQLVRKTFHCFYIGLIQDKIKIKYNWITKKKILNRLFRKEQTWNRTFPHFMNQCFQWWWAIIYYYKYNCYDKLLKTFLRTYPCWLKLLSRVSILWQAVWLYHVCCTSLKLYFLKSS